MSNRHKRFDNQLELDLDNIVRQVHEARSPQAGMKSLPQGALDTSPQVAAELHAALQNAAKNNKSREQVADEVSHLTGRRISKAMLDNYVSRASSKEPYQLPAALVNAICQVCDYYGLIRLLCRTSKFEAVGAEELAYMKLGQLQLEKERITKEERETRKKLGEVL